MINITRLIPILTLLTLQSALAQQTGNWGDQGDGTYKNPILESNFPDNDVIRVGDTFYCMSSTMHFVPGMQILRSKDLINWEYSNQVMPAPISFSKEYDMKAPPSMENRGTWAGSFGYNGEDYFAYWSFNRLHLAPPGSKGEVRRTFLSMVYSTAKSMEGPWSEPQEITHADGTSIHSTDPGVFFDLDTKRAWMACHGGQIYEMSWDGSTLLKNEDEGIVVTTTLKGEAAKIHKIDGMYYYTNAHWQEHDGVRQRMATFHRAKNMEGPWEGRLAMENGNGTDRSPSQGTLLKLEDGTWWFMHQLARGEPDVRYNGRPQMLEPVTWGDDGWPIFGEDTDGDGIGEVVWQYKKPILGYPVNAPATDDNFNSPTLGMQWLWNFNPLMDRWSLTERPGFLRLKSCTNVKKSPADSLAPLPNVIGQQMMGRHDNVMTAKFDLSGMEKGQEVGFHISSIVNYVIGVKKNETGEQSLFFKHAPARGEVKVINGPALNQQEIWFRSTVDNGLAHFFYSLDGKTFLPLGEEVRLLFSGFITNMVGFYSKQPEEKGFLDVDWITYDYDGPKGK